MKHWHIDQVAWGSFDPGQVDPEIVPLVKAAAMVEKNGSDYTLYLRGVFHDDPDFKAAADHWGVEEEQHGDTLGRWIEMADPGWNFEAAFARYRAGYKVDTSADASIHGGRTGELIARCIVEIGTSSYYTALGEATTEPVLKEICKLISGDECRHFKLFYDHMRRYLAREKLSFGQRLKVSAARIGESEDDELAYAFHCGNEPESMTYSHDRCIAGYMGRAMGFYRFRHIERGMGMMFKSIGLQPRGRMAGWAAKGAWHLLQRRAARYRRDIALPQSVGQPARAAA